MSRLKADNHLECLRSTRLTIDHHLMSLVTYHTPPQEVAEVSGHLSQQTACSTKHKLHLTFQQSVFQLSIWLKICTSLHHPTRPALYIDTPSDHRAGRFDSTSAIIWQTKMANYFMADFVGCQSVCSIQSRSPEKVIITYQMPVIVWLYLLNNVFLVTWLYSKIKPSKILLTTEKYLTLNHVINR